MGCFESPWILLCGVNAPLVLMLGRICTLFAGFGGILAVDGGNVPILWPWCNFYLFICLFLFLKGRAYCFMEFSTSICIVP